MIMEDRQQFMTFFIAKGFLKFGSNDFILKRRKGCSWNSATLYMGFDSMKVIVKIGDMKTDLDIRYENFRDAPTAYNFIKEHVRRIYNEFIDKELNAIL